MTIRSDTPPGGRALRVLMFGWEFPPYQSGGLATATLGLVKGLLGRGAEVTLVVPFPVTTSPLPRLRIVSAARGFEGRLKHLRVPSPLTAYGGGRAYLETLRTQLAGTRGGPVYGLNLFDEVERFAAVAEVIAADEEHDIIDSHDWITYRAGIAARRVSGRPLIAHIHATEFDRSGEAVNAEISHREWEGLSAADWVISNSHTLKHQVVRRHGISASKIMVVHWGIDHENAALVGTSPNPLPPEHPVVLFLGRVTRQKGPDYFVEIARRVAEFVPTARFVMAGTGDMLPQVTNRAVELGLEDRFHFAGPVAGRDVDRAFRLAKVCVMPSVSEPFGLVALESMRSGTPCIVPKGSGAAEVLRNAFKVDFWDIDEMTNKIVAIIRYPELHDELRRQGTDELRATRFSLDDPARRTLDVYQRTLTKEQVMIA